MRDEELRQMFRSFAEPVAGAAEPPDPRRIRARGRRRRRNLVGGTLLAVAAVIAGAVGVRDDLDHAAARQGEQPGRCAGHRAGQRGGGRQGHDPGHPRRRAHLGARVARQGRPARRELLQRLDRLGARRRPGAGHGRRRPALDQARRAVRGGPAAGPLRQPHRGLGRGRRRRPGRRGADGADRCDPAGPLGRRRPDLVRAGGAGPAPVGLLHLAGRRLAGQRDRRVAQTVWGWAGAACADQVRPPSTEWTSRVAPVGTIGPSPAWSPPPATPQPSVRLTKWTRRRAPTDGSASLVQCWPPSAVASTRPSPSAQPVEALEKFTSRRSPLPRHTRTQVRPPSRVARIVSLPTTTALAGPVTCTASRLLTLPSGSVVEVVAPAPGAPVGGGAGAVVAGPGAVWLGGGATWPASWVLGISPARTPTAPAITAATASSVPPTRLRRRRLP